VDAAQDVVVSEIDCGTFDGIEVGSLIEGGEVIEHLSARILGRVVLEDLKDPDGETIVAKNEEIREIQPEGCRRCGLREDKDSLRPSHGRSKEGSMRALLRQRSFKGRLVSIRRGCGNCGRPSPSASRAPSSMRTFHISGAASRRVEVYLEARNEGYVKLLNVKGHDNRDNCRWL